MLGLNQPVSPWGGQSNDNTSKVFENLSSTYAYVAKVKAKYQFNKTMQMNNHVRIDTKDVILENIFTLDLWKTLNKYIK
jgi:hypothetical protein